jgi:hypothetical protein
MYKTILFPTDFSIGSLNIVRSVMQSMDSKEKCRIILVHGYRPSVSISDLLFTSNATRVRELSGNTFEAACEVIQTTFESSIADIRTELFIGFTQNAFNNFLEANKVSEIYLPQAHVLELPHKCSFDVVPYIRKSGLVVNEVPWNAGVHMPEKGMVAELFNDRMVLQ